ncbi:hypothetical protein ACHAWF_016267 [Thalassiosira exigua]
MMTMCWLKLYDTEHVMAGRWGYSHGYCGNTVKDLASKLQSLKRLKIRLDGIGVRRTFLGSIDCVHCMIFEMRTDPDSKWYSHKSNGAGVSYEVVVDLVESRALWTAGPEPASTHDITFFRGGKMEGSNRKKNEKKWDKSALYFQLPKGKRLIGDSGYEGEPETISTTKSEHDSQTKEFFARAKSRHETFNKRLKDFGVLSRHFRHGGGVRIKN